MKSKILCRIKFEFIHEIFFNLLRVDGIADAVMSINFHILFNKQDRAFSFCLLTLHPLREDDFY